MGGEGSCQRGPGKGARQILPHAFLGVEGKKEGAEEEQGPYCSLLPS